MRRSFGWLHEGRASGDSSDPTSAALSTIDATGTIKEKEVVSHGQQAIALLPAKVPNARILIFGYDANVVDWRGMVSQNRIGNHSMDLLVTMATYREDDDTQANRPIIFVAHSLGGLIREDALLYSRQRPERHLQGVLQSTRGIIFLGTPYHGSGLDMWAELLARYIGLIKQTNPQILRVLKSDSEVLVRIQDSFHVMVVPLDSAILPSYTPIGIHANYMDMTKLGGADDSASKLLQENSVGGRGS
ncbi:hypothetical protein AOQ84DRAFT_362043 [Glonium stellatum]|uniref:DUF676 domain-containing protein n=1 Tax=Glonium stellatum TaxID=574774 RepID=A0A8E2F5C6_9PEZI|nr:hypothetical protein AOQ84DRAFT_362043 [Glonium stellatum]